MTSSPIAPDIRRNSRAFGLSRAGLRASIVEFFNNSAVHMATMNFSIPDEVRDAFNREFSGQNKSALIARLIVGSLPDHGRRPLPPQGQDAAGHLPSARLAWLSRPH